MISNENISSDRLRSPVSSLLRYVDPNVTSHPTHLGLQLDQVKTQDVSEARQQLVVAGQKFEAYFVSYLLKVMRETVPEGPLANKQGAYFYSFYDEEIGIRAAEAGGIGIAKMVQEYAEKYFPSRSLERSSLAG